MFLIFQDRLVEVIQQEPLSTLVRFPDGNENWVANHKLKPIKERKQKTIDTASAPVV